ncbi:MAG: GerAB/ArcD/ProY family transporter, partial [Bacilli bacterium]
MKIQITNGMLTALIISVAYPKAIGITQGILAREVGGDMWLATCMAMVQGLFVILLTVFVVRRTPGINFIDQAGILIGKWGGKIVGIILFLFFVGAFGGMMITYVYHLKDYFLPDAPVALLIIVALLVGLYSNYHGLEVIGRLALVAMLSVFLLNYLLMIGSIADFDMQQFLPVFESGVWNTVW